MTFLSSYSSTIPKQAQTSSWSQSAWCPQVSQSISVFRKRCQESFFFPLSFGGFEALFKGALLLLPQCNSKVLIIFFSVQQHLQSVDRLVSSFSRDHRKIKKKRKKKADFFSQTSQDWRPLCGLWHHQITTKSYQQKQIICFLALQVCVCVFFSICHCKSGNCAT